MCVCVCVCIERERENTNITYKHQFQNKMSQWKSVILYRRNNFLKIKSNEIKLNLFKLLERYSKDSQLIRY